MVRCGFRPFLHHTLRCGLAKIITALHLTFTVTCTVQCDAMQCDLEFSQNHNHIAPHFCDHMCGTMYKMWFEQIEVGIFFKFWAFSIQLKTNFYLYFEPSFKILSQFFFILNRLSQSTLTRVIKLLFFLKTRIIKLLIIYLILIYREGAVWLCHFGAIFCGLMNTLSPK